MLRLLVVLSLLAVPAAAEEWTVHLDRSPDRFVAYDGDTLLVVIDGLPAPLRRASVRVLGIDTPEIKGECEVERRRAADARAFVLHAFADAEMVTLDVVGWDKYGGRIDAHVRMPNGGDLAGALLEAGLARPYAGGKREGWCG